MKNLSMIGMLLPAISLLACGGDPTLGDSDNLGVEEAELLSGALPYRGVNLAGAEFAVDPSGNGALPGTFGVDYTYPDPQYASGYNSASYFVSKGMTTFRLPFRWERLQPTRKAVFNAAEQSRLTTTTDNLLAKGAAVVLDPHNYARYGTSLIGSSAVPNSDFADFWGRLASLYKSNSKVVFAIMNEPHDMSTEQWVSAANAAIAAIRATGANNLIVVPGNGWDGAHSWSQNWYGTANSTAMLQIKDPGNNYAYEVHQYLDDASSGASVNCTSSTIGSQRLAGFTSWLKANGK
ncbi:MAG: glycoside hydrolase family 5 protein, partial [Byssovorax sp.]